MVYLLFIFLTNEIIPIGRSNDAIDDILQMQQSYFFSTFIELSCSGSISIRNKVFSKFKIN
jgi:hypothetical protein